MIFGTVTRPHLKCLRTPDLNLFPGTKAISFTCPLSTRSFQFNTLNFCKSSVSEGKREAWGSKVIHFPFPLLSSPFSFPLSVLLFLLSPFCLLCSLSPSLSLPLFLSTCCSVLFFVVVWGRYLAILRSYFFLCTRRSFLAGSEFQMGYQGMNQGLLHPRQVPYMLYSLSLSLCSLHSFWISPLTPFPFSTSLSLTHTNTQTHTHAHAHARTVQLCSRSASKIFQMVCLKNT